MKNGHAMEYECGSLLERIDSIFSSNGNCRLEVWPGLVQPSSARLKVLPLL
jgi:hypothetical protein